MAESVVSFLVGKLDSFIEQEVGLLKNIRKEVIYIKYEFESIQALLKDADAKGELEQGEQVKVWLKEVRHVAFEIEDVLDEFLLRYHAHRPHVHGLGTYGFVKKINYFFKTLFKRRDLAARIQDIKIRVEDVSKRRVRYNLSNLGQGSTIPSSSLAITGRGRDPQLDALFIEESKIVGIDEPREKLIGWLVHEPDSKTGVISVFGPGGLGKTTLVKKVYDNKVVKEHFACSAWITVSQTFEIKSLLKDLILQTLNEAEKEKLLPRLERSEATTLKDILRDHLLSKRYVVVVDDIWKDDAWKEIKSAFPDNECGSRIIVTTRSLDVAKLCVQNTRYAFELQPLKPDDARALFGKVAFKSDVESYRSQYLREIIEKFLNKCKGLPLAIVTIAGVLASKDTIHWGQVYGDFDSSLGDINTILSLSYNDLSYHLKTCLLYFSIFPEDYSIRCSRLLCLWAAEGFVDLEARQGITKEQAAERYLDELIARSLVQAEKIDDSGRIRECGIHDLLHDFLVKKAREQDFVAFLVERRHGMEINGDMVRRISFFNKKNDVDEHNMKFFSHARSLFAFGEVTSFKSCTVSKDLSGGGMRLLKVLDLEGAPLKEFPCEIVAHLFFLRYLSLRNSKLNSVPDSVGKLVNLETLDLKNTRVSELPIGILKLQRLRHILSAQMYSLKLPAGIGRITTLEKLKWVRAHRGIGEELGTLTQLRTLSITEVVGEEGRGVLASIEKMNYLHSLKLFGSDEEILELQNVRCPPLLLQRLWLQGLLLDESLHWIPQLENLTHLALGWSHIKDSAVVEGLQRLPNLVELWLGFEAFDGKELLLNKGGFPRLRHLKLWGLSNLELIRIEEGAMPGIQSLSLSLCMKLEKVPIGTQHLTTLKTIKYWSLPSNFEAEISDYCWKDGHSPLIKDLSRR